MKATQALLSRAHACRRHKRLLTRLLRGEKSIEITRTNLRKAAKAGLDLIWFAQWLAFEIGTHRHVGDFVVQYRQIGHRLDDIAATRAFPDNRQRLTALVNLLMRYAGEYDRTFPRRTV